MITVTLKDGTKKEYEEGITIQNIAKSISQGLGKSAICAKVNGEITDLTNTVDEDINLEILTFDTEYNEKEPEDAFPARRVFWHTTAHILAQAVKRLYPDVKLTIGPPIDKGFYYDFEFQNPFSADDLAKVEKEMQKIVKENLSLKRFVLPRNEAIELMKKRGESYKIELIDSLPEDEELSFYEQGEFIDLCVGKHLPSTGMVKSLKLLSVAGAYWRADQSNTMLTRIYGISYPKKELLDAYLNRLEEAKKRDHRKLGKELELFDIYEEGPGFPFFLPKGMVIRNQLEDFWRIEHEKAGYLEIRTPIILNEELWKRSGHYDHYKDNMYSTIIDEEIYRVKPMNCPGALLVYKSKLHSYRDLPKRVGELGLVHRHELSGALHGLMRVRCFTQDDAHIFMMPEHIKDEIKGVFELIDKFYSIFGFTYKIELSTRPENSMGSDEDWEMATNSLKEALFDMGRDYKINEGDGAFYGPKIDFHLEDSIGRTWQCGTIQLDFQMPERFDLTYIGSDNEKHRPIMIHRVIYGSVERFIGILTEHFAAAFPLWLSPVQIKILPVSHSSYEYSKKISEEFIKSGFRTQIDIRNEKIGFKIREAQLSKIPYMLIIGDKEVEQNTITVRSLRGGDLGTYSLYDFIQKITKENTNKDLTN
ncbi:MAG: threonine--tRNA ligase [Defluviitaleaceae bacterium]|nr:threonine--tRNA ligase [Defluviitaleaceae bacterium]